MSYTCGSRVWRIQAHREQRVIQPDRDRKRDRNREIQKKKDRDSDRKKNR